MVAIGCGQQLQRPVRIAYFSTMLSITPLAAAAGAGAPPGSFLAGAGGGVEIPVGMSRSIRRPAAPGKSSRPSTISASASRCVVAAGASPTFEGLLHLAKKGPLLLVQPAVGVAHADRHSYARARASVVGQDAARRPVRSPDAAARVEQARTGRLPQVARHLAECSRSSSLRLTVGERRHEAQSQNRLSFLVMHHSRSSRAG